MVLNLGELLGKQQREDILKIICPDDKEIALQRQAISELKDLDNELQNRNIVSKDNAEAIEAPLPEGTETATREGNPLFATFLENSTGLKRKLEDISKEDADYFEAELQKLGINSDEQFVNFIDEMHTIS